ncbi:NAD(P)H-binding protein [Yinghuangia sp. ASG 101]|uniref:NAD(P)H-binding protein n=1 Tax=Yinghuangia sp. ASG 101 TaxID=2896848 RepID=UPI001E56ECC8|nr:NAD(P)H-binding protein [Yinghuangia sp. ASG 101]UGQ09651.1 NAD(P)H-binding protein [Yinghuangia sp. ASG 101]
MTDTILVLGGTGKTGRRVVERLTARGATPRIGSRGAETPFDWNDPSTWRPVLKDVAAVYIAYAPDLAVPGAPDAVGAFAEAAVAAGTRRLVLLSGRGEPEAQSAEERVAKVAERVGAVWTVVRASWFMQNFDENFLIEPIVAGEVALPLGDVAEPFVDTDDIADVAVAALTEDGHHGKTYEVTGPRLLSFADAVAEIAAATGRDIAYVTVPIDAYAAALRDAGLDAETVGFLRYLFTEVMDGRNQHLADGVRQALGRAPRDFADYARSVAATGAWNA